MVGSRSCRTVGESEMTRQLEAERKDGSPAVVRVECKAAARAHELPVAWTKGAVFEFEDEAAMRAWVDDQDATVEGTLFVAGAPDSDAGLLVDYHLKYTATG
jgi:hypothetical protein